ncbi:hypothetical protein VNI00_018089 [Paramarasmius palmivorus]|uniref:Uncharacterized protein n=1 Tax=Paramarasmius palmivorus TaxID=297713 RepID=A0AAW0B2E9_9AGAR
MTGNTRQEASSDGENGDKGTSNLLNSLPFPAQRITFDETSVYDLINVRRVSKDTLRDVNEYYASTLGAGRIYGTFFSEERLQTKFRKAIARAGALVSGISMAKVFLRDQTDISHIDVYTPWSTANSIAEIVAEANYTFKPLPRKTKDGRTYDAQHSVFEQAVSAEFSKAVPNTGDLDEICDDSTAAGVFIFEDEHCKTIRIIGTKTEPIEVILAYPTALHMNFATATQYVSLYPKTSFIDKRILKLAITSPADKHTYEEYETKGWTIMNELSAEEALHPNHELSLQIRWFGDPHCWIINLSPLDDMDLEDARYRPLSVTSWHLCCPFTDSTRISFERLEDARLPSTYIMSPEAEIAVVQHPCFNPFTDKGTKFYQEGAENPEDGGEHYFENETDSATGGESIPSPSTSERKLQRYKAGLDPCTHGGTSGNYNLEKAISEYLAELYHLIAECHTKNVNYKRIRENLIHARETFTKMEDNLVQPTGHAIYLIFRCIDDVRKTSGNKPLEYMLELTLVPMNRAVVTTCTILAPEEDIHHITRKLAGQPNWSDDLHMDANVIMRFQSIEEYVQLE